MNRFNIEKFIMNLISNQKTPFFEITTKALDQGDFIILVPNLSNSDWMYWWEFKFGNGLPILVDSYSGIKNRSIEMKYIIKGNFSKIHALLTQEFKQEFKIVSGVKHLMYGTHHYTIEISKEEINWDIKLGISLFFYTGTDLSVHRFFEKYSVSRTKYFLYWWFGMIG